MRVPRRGARGALARRPLHGSLRLSSLAGRPRPPPPAAAADPVVRPAAKGRVVVAEELARGRELEILVNGHEQWRLRAAAPARDRGRERGIRVGWACSRRVSGVHANGHGGEGDTAHEYREQKRFLFTRSKYSPGVGLVARAHLVASQEHVALAVGQVVQHDEVQVDLLGAVPVLGLQRERARVGRGRVVDGERRRGASLVLLQPDGPLLAARHLALLRVDPGELRGRF